MDATPHEGRAGQARKAVQPEDQEASQGGVEKPYQVGGMRLRFPELQAEDQEARKVRAESGSKQGLKDGWEEDADGMLL